MPSFTSCILNFGISKAVYQITPITGYKANLTAQLYSPAGKRGSCVGFKNAMSLDLLCIKLPPRQRFARISFIAARRPRRAVILNSNHFPSGLLKTGGLETSENPHWYIRLLECVIDETISGNKELL
ncbi:uncharacterized protein PGTG_01798 [Puccinia graminis f. sp. tritici CRL 75-36-700-3]|uniref:Uncharacterized protein n=1 Tax=Puccinia graminis f. sp. tritici (strain CRL 75-36-700-3 / race SCCL) TaxID=418459 RepID=E3JTD1_PUCGT|nr:uncharacterized protein PGTG_01798 [Puccinia graminis f. sp. tritici CRL 75-36-700-3]EFP75205.2 hypothetical protein PGTG_01798 [Puccinia graminis f. sp. tritici CRL 75-36-700-3]